MDVGLGLPSRFQNVAKDLVFWGSCKINQKELPKGSKV